MIARWLVLAAGLLVAASAAPAEETRSRRLVGVAIRGSAFLASVDGELQTPLGGRSGTTSSGRPTTEEVGLDGVGVHGLVDLELRLLEDHVIHFSYAYLERNGKETLDRELVTHGQTFPEGARVDSRLELPFGRLGYRAHWLPVSFRGWSIAPEVGAARIDFRYRLRSRNATGKADREYVLYFAYWGAQIEGPLLEPLRGELALLASAGISNVSSIDADLRVRVPVVQNDFVSAAVVIGLKGIWFRYKDDQQEEQNEIDLRVGAFSGEPWAGLHVGLQLEF